MKKTAILFLLILVSVFANAQDLYRDQFYLTQKVIEIVAVIFTFVLIVFFILALLKRVFDYRLKNKVIDKQVTEGMALSVLGSSEPKEIRFINIKWFAILAGIGAGLLIVNYTQPLGIHSLAIMFLSISASFLGYHLFLTMQGKKNQ